MLPNGWGSPIPIRIPTRNYDQKKNTYTVPLIGSNMEVENLSQTWAKRRSAAPSWIEPTA